MDLNNSILPMSILILLHNLVIVVIVLLDAWFSEDNDIVRPIYSIPQILSEFCEIVEYSTFLKASGTKSDNEECPPQIWAARRNPEILCDFMGASPLIIVYFIIILFLLLASPIAFPIQVEL
uniref:Uncharacterized protein n=1 Tax=Romanomermis culicivorax TaxID=13658 RepID=A0A915KRQ7_ROMCU